MQKYLVIIVFRNISLNIMKCKCKESPKEWTLEHFEASILHTKQKLMNIDHDLICKPSYYVRCAKEF
jgi:hypothetical protein